MWADSCFQLFHFLPLQTHLINCEKSPNCSLQKYFHQPSSLDKVGKIQGNLNLQIIYIVWYGCGDNAFSWQKFLVNSPYFADIHIVQKTKKLSPPLRDDVKAMVCCGCSDSDIITRTNLNSFDMLLFDIKALSFKYYTPGISEVDHCASLNLSRGGSFLSNVGFSSLMISLKKTK